ncbi:MAG: immunoglobulin domain-containing protein, partial [Spirosomataceae bacterium]
MTNKYLTLKIIYGILFLIIPSLVFSQNALRSGDGWGSGWSNNDFFSATGFGNTFGKTYQNTSGAGNRYFRLFTSWNSQNREHGPSGANDIQVSIGSPINLETGSSKAYFINVANSSNNYVFRTPNGDGISNTPRLVVFEIQGSVRSISSVSQLPTASNVKSCNQVTITANTGTNLPNGQGVYLRYATSSNFANSVVVPMTNSSTGNYSGTITAHPVGTTVYYYLFTSGSGLTISPTDSDWFTINGNNNNGSNYSYTVGTPNLTASITNNSPSVCLGSSISLNSNTAVTYAWSGPNSFTSSSQNVDITNASVNNGGTYTLTVSDGYGCSATTTTEVIVNANPSQAAGSNSPVCAGNAINLTSNSASGNVWTGPNSFSSTQQNPVINSASSSNSGVYTLTVTDANGCSATATTEVV